MRDLPFVIECLHLITSDFELIGSLCKLFEPFLGVDTIIQQFLCFFYI